MTPFQWILRLQAWRRDEAGHGTTEYMLIVLLLLAVVMMTGLRGPFDTTPFAAVPVRVLQQYVDGIFYCLDIALN